MTSTNMWLSRCDQEEKLLRQLVFKYTEFLWDCYEGDPKKPTQEEITEAVEDFMKVYNDHIQYI